MPKNSFYFTPCGYTLEHFKQWGKQGGCPQKYVSASERQKAYRRRKALFLLQNSQRTGYWQN